MYLLVARCLRGGLRFIRALLGQVKSRNTPWGIWSRYQTGGMRPVRRAGWVWPACGAPAAKKSGGLNFKPELRGLKPWFVLRLQDGMGSGFGESQRTPTKRAKDPRRNHPPYHFFLGVPMAPAGWCMWKDLAQIANTITCSFRYLPLGQSDTNTKAGPE